MRYRPCRPHSISELDRTLAADQGRRLLEGRAPDRHAAGSGHPPGGRARRCSISAPTTISAWRTIRAWSRRRPTACAAMASAWPRCASSAAPRTSTASWRASSPASSAPRTRSSIPAASTPMAGCSRPSSARRTRSSPTRSTTPRIIDGIRLCKAKRFRYRNNDMGDLEAQLKAADEAGARFKLIATDGVFSMDGIIANLKAICDLADRYDALVMVDDSHAVGFVGERGRGTPELLRRRRPHRHPAPARWARRWAAPAAAMSRRGARWSSCCASARAPISSPTRWRPASSRPRWRC